MTKKLILITAIVVLSGCTTTTKLEGIYTKSWNMVEEKDGYLHEKGLLKRRVPHAYLADCWRNGQTILMAEVVDGKVKGAQCLHPKRGWEDTVRDGYGTITAYDYETSEVISTRKIVNGLLQAPQKGVKLRVLQFSPPVKTRPSPETMVGLTKDETDEGFGPVPSTRTVKAVAQQLSAPMDNACSRGLPASDSQADSIPDDAESLVLSCEIPSENIKTEKFEYEEPAVSALVISNSTMVADSVPVRTGCACNQSCGGKPTSPVDTKASPPASAEPQTEVAEFAYRELVSAALACALALISVVAIRRRA